ncbi:CHAP domain-containing protein [Lentzea sp. BCCO 10_0856]|uniref:CHAP domain-containing protein n=1 Tax=Lentzea miocenica TaxID=3095431 RepID=A0ABU4STP1_9PSEU|nr:CHAP domain-containing protein [Lentzea sp. BCCO 10_0856]MDX8029184.1 CHAP domain-containing protein [Lentzea sp. BCCO 10_0856]
MPEHSVADVEPLFDAVQERPHADLFAGVPEAEVPDVAAEPLWPAVAAAVDPRVAEALRYAGAELRRGVCETGDNGGVPYTRYVQWFGSNLPRGPWCAYFVSWCWDNATDRNRRVPWPNPGWVESVRGWASAHGKLVNRPRQGDLFGEGGAHIGWVLSVNGSGFTTIEGNASDCVRSYQRSTGGLWFARIA